MKDSFRIDQFCRPIEACVVLLPVYEFARTNTTFASIAVETLNDNKEARLAPFPLTVLTLSSYLLSHATSTSSARSLAYANLTLNCLLAFLENDEVMEAFCQPTKYTVRLCRQVSSLGEATVFY